MRTPSPFDRVLAIAGAVVAALPVAAMLATSLVGSLLEGRFLMDYLMPAELGLLLAVGAALLLLAALRTRRDAVAIGATAATAALAFAAMSAFAVWTGLADGRHEPTGWRLALVVSMLVVYVLAAIALPVLGWHLARALRRPHGPRHGPPAAHPTAG